jgi:hypothetical protein
MLKFAFLGIVLMCGLAWEAGAAETIVTKRINAANRLTPLKKITVGPDDQYHGSVDPGGQSLIFTRKSDLIPHLCRQDLKTGEVVNFLPLTADSQEASIAPDGVVAFTYYQFNARGDICYRALRGSENDKFVCLKAPDGERSSPFWKNSNELGYLLRDIRTQKSQILVQNLLTGQTDVLAEGKVWSPTMHPGGQYLFYNELEDGPAGATRVLVMKDLKTGNRKAVHLDLPGISGFPSVSDDERYVFFSHYLNDTNNDNVIDGNDNSVVFRLPIERLAKNGSLFPEQLTSAESNCSFPRAHANDLYVTCAFEGHLDVYRMPTSGVVPAAWDEKLLTSAHQTSRTYEERILILNNMKYRMPRIAGPDIDERILSDHLLADDTSAARYFLKVLQNEADPTKKNFYEIVYLFIQGRERKKAQPAPEVVSRAFQDEIAKIDAKIAAVPGNDRLKKIVRGLLKTYVNGASAAANLLKQVHFDTPAFPLERYYYFELANWTLPRTQRSPESMLPVYRDVMSAPELTTESRLYYAFDFLKHLETATLSERIAQIQKFNHDLPEPVAALLKSEEIALKLIAASDDKDKQAQYRELDKLMSSSRSDYFLRKALYIRAILNFAAHAEFNYLSFVATNWLRYTANQDTEFAYAREVYVNATLDQAYDNFGKRNYVFASDYFYGSLSLTDDLESHYGYIRSMVLQNQRKTVDVRYANLVKREFINDNMKFVRAFLILLDAAPSDRKDVRYLDEALSQLEAMEQDRDSPVRYLMMAYCYLEKLSRTADGYDFSTPLFESAHRNLMLAYDVGRDNVRVRAAALMNLGLLHQRAQNHGLATKFFATRKPLGFVSDEDEARFHWFYARSLFYTHQPDLAAAEITLAQSLKSFPKAYIYPFEERRAFYLQAAQKCGPAAEAYAKLLASNHITGDLNLAKANLGYGFCLVKLKRDAEARTVLQTSIGYIDRLLVIPKGEDRLIDFQPVRLKCDAYGLLARVGTPAERIAALEKRATLLPQATALYNDGPALEIQNRLQLAELYSPKDPAKAAVKMREALALAEKLGDSGQYLSRAVYQTAVNYLTHVILHRTVYANESGATIKKVVDKILAAYTQQKQPQPVLEYQKAKLQILWAAYSGADPATFAGIVEKSGVKNPELNRLAKALSQR